MGIRMFALALCLLASAAPAQDPLAQDPATGDKVEPELWVRLERDPTPATVLVLLEDNDRALGVAEVQELVLAGLAHEEFEARYLYRNLPALSGRASAAGVAQLAADPRVRAVGLDLRGRAHLQTSVPFLGADVVQAQGFTGEGVVVAVLDSGVDSDHPDLADDLTAGAMHFLDQGLDVGPGAEDDHGHGTHVAGIVTSGGQVAGVGVAPDAQVLAIKVLKADGSGWTSDWAAGIDHVVSVLGAHPGLALINLSLGTDALYGGSPCDADSVANLVLQAALQSARDAGLLALASSGNDGACGAMASPACLSGASAVAAVYVGSKGAEPDAGTYAELFGPDFGACSDPAALGNALACFSNQSSSNALAAPGRSIQGPGLGGGTATFTGTSQAAPHVAGVAALLLEAAPTLTPDELLSALTCTAVSTTDDCGAGPVPARPDALAALQLLQTAPAEVLRPGSPPNPSAFLPGLSGGPVIGGTWDPIVDHSAFVPGALVDFVGLATTSTNLASPFGTLLVGFDPPFVLTTVPGTPFAVPIPDDCALVGQSAFTQGGSLDPLLAPVLANAIDVVVGFP